MWKCNNCRVKFETPKSSGDTTNIPECIKCISPQIERFKVEFYNLDS